MIRCPSVCPIRPLPRCAAGLLLWARRAGDIKWWAPRSKAISNKCEWCHVEMRGTSIRINTDLLNRRSQQWPVKSRAVIRSVRRVCCSGPGEQEISIDSGGRPAAWRPSMRFSASSVTKWPLQSPDFLCIHFFLEWCMHVLVMYMYNAKRTQFFDCLLQVVAVDENM